MKCCLVLGFAMRGTTRYSVTDFGEQTNDLELDFCSQYFRLLRRVCLVEHPSSDEYSELMICLLVEEQNCPLPRLKDRLGLHLISEIPGGCY